MSKSGPLSDHRDAAEAHPWQLGCVICQQRAEDEVERLRAILDGIDDEAIDRAAQVLYESNPDHIYADEGPTWHAEPEAFKESYRQQALAVLRAAGSLASDETEA